MREVQVMEAMYEARSGQFDKAEQKLNEANQELNKAHRFQTELIKKESGGVETHMTFVSYTSMPKIIS
jgi:cellobiose PTS system EIIA component